MTAAHLQSRSSLYSRRTDKKLCEAATQSVLLAVCWCVLSVTATTRAHLRSDSFATHRCSGMRQTTAIGSTPKWNMVARWSFCHTRWLTLVRDLSAPEKKAIGPHAV